MARWPKLGSTGRRLLVRLLLPLALGSWIGGGLQTAAAAAPASDDDSASIGRQEADIAAQRQRVQRRYDDKARDCQQRFVVTACLNDAQKERRDDLAPLRQEQLRLETLERKQRAAARLDEIEAKQRADAAKETAAAAAVRAEPAASRPADFGAARPSSPPADPLPRPALHAPISADERARREGAALARFQARQTEAQQRRAAADARNAARAASGKVARPLPVPQGAASASQ